VLGARWGILVFLLDAAKGFLAVRATHPLALVFGRTASQDALLTAGLAAGVAAILGHVFSPWLGFRGGRGVATSLGVFLAIAAIPTLCAFGLWILLLFLSRRVSVASIGAALTYPFLVFFLFQDDAHKALLVGIAALVSLLVIVRHKANIERLLQGTEPPIHGGRV
jgi:glycerol-3-phosphate acyltransferase PlsY